MRLSARPQTTTTAAQLLHHGAPFRVRIILSHVVVFLFKWLARCILTLSVNNTNAGDPLPVLENQPQKRFRQGPNYGAGAA